MFRSFYCLLAFASSALALPSGGEVVQGQATLLPSPSALQINANGKAILHWDRFDIASHEVVHFIQSQKGQGILNRVMSGPGSQILGRLEANCPIYLVNPQGIFIGTNACIDTAGFLASTADISNEAFWQGELEFRDFGDSGIVNLGIIRAKDTDCVLIARHIDNQGSIEAKNGSVMMATHEVMLNPNTKESIFIRVEEANGGKIGALAAELKTMSPYEQAINHTGAIEAKDRIHLLAEKRGTVVDGILLAREIHILGQTVALEDHARIDASGGRGGTILIGGDYQGANPDVLNAQSTRIASGAEISADGWSGDAGKIIIWAEKDTWCQAKISGAAFGSVGNGGFVEISGKDTLAVTGIPNLTSRSGKPGTLLLDPGTVLVTAGVGLGPTTYGSTSINGVLNGGADLIIDTAGGVAGAQTLTVDNTAAISWNTMNTLSLIAGQNVVIQAGATINATVNGNLTITGQGAVAGTYIGLATAGSLTVTSGTMQLSGIGGNAGAANAGVNITGGTISATSGTVTIQGTGGLASNGISKTGGTVTTSGGGPLSLTGTAGTGGTGVGISLTGGTLTTTNNGNLSLIGNGAGAGAGSNGVVINVGVSVGGSGTLTINGTASPNAASSLGISVAFGIAVTTNSGLLSMTGIGGGTGSNNRGIALNAGGVNLSTASGGITMNVTGGGDATGSGNIGLALINTAGGPGTLGITSTSGDISITALGTSVGVSNNEGIRVQNTVAVGSIPVQIQTGGNFTINATGVTTGSGTGNIGLNILQYGGVFTTGAIFNITAIGDANGNSSSSFGLSSQGGIASLSSGGTLQIIARGASNSTGSGNIGISYGTNSAIQSSGAMTVDAIGSGNSTGSGNIGINYVVNGTATRGFLSSSGDVSITARGATTGISNNVGIRLQNTNAVGSNPVQIQSAGNLTVDARGVATGSGTGNIGVDLQQYGGIFTTGSTFNITAIGDENGNSSSSFGLNSQSGIPALSSGGTLQLTAWAAPNGTGSSNIGISYTTNSAIQSSGAMTVDAIGSGNSTGSGNIGINYVINGTATRGFLSSSGDVSITARGATTGISNNVGLRLQNTNAVGSNPVSIQSAGNLTVDARAVTTGSGTGNFGLDLQQLSQISTTGPTLNITAIADANGNSSNSFGLRSLNGGGSITSSGTLQLTAWAAPNGTGSGNIGISYPSALTVQSTGTMTIDAKGSGNSTGDSNIGITFIVNGTNCGFVSTGGNISITALGAITGASNNVGLVLQNTQAVGTPIVRILAPGSIIVNATALTNGNVSGNNNIGLNLLQQSRIQSTGGLATNSVTVTASSIGNGTGNQGASLTSGALINSLSGDLTVTGTGGVTSGNTSQGIFINNGSITSTNGNVSVTGNGGFASNGIHITQGTISTGGSGTVTCMGTGGGGTGGYGIFLTGPSSLIQSANGLISVTGNGGGTGANAEGIGLFSASRINVTGIGGITLNGTASSGGGSNSRGIIINGATSAATTVSGAIIANGTGGNGAAATGNSGIELSASGKINSTSGSISGTCFGGTGTTSCRGIFITGSGSQITTGSGAGINFTATGGGSTNNGQGIFLTTAGVITTTSNAPIILAGTGSSTGSSNEGIFMTAASTTVSTVTGNIQMTGTLGGGTTNGITVDTSATVTTSTAGLVTLNSTGNVAVQNNSTVQTLGVGGPGINNISVTSNGLSVAGGAAGRALVSATNGNIAVTATGPVSVTGSTAASTFGQITVVNVANTITIQMTDLTLSGSSGSGALAEISTNGGLLTINGTGAISLTGGSNTNTPAQIITKTNAIAGNAILIGQTMQPTTLMLQGGSIGTPSYAVIASNVGGNIACSTSGNWTLTGGSNTGVNDSRAGIFTGLTTGSGNINIGNAGDISITGGSNTGVNNAGIFTGVVNGSGNITATAASFSLTGGSGSGTNFAQIATPAGGGAISLTATGMTTNALQGGSGGNTAAKILTTNGNINIAATGNVSLTGGSLAGSTALIQCATQGAITLNALNLNISSGSIAGQSGVFTQSGNINITCTQNATLSGMTPGNAAIVRTLGSDLTMSVGGSINLVGASLTTPAPTGNLLLIAGVDITIDGTSQVSALGTPPGSSLTLVVDNNFPTAPNVGPGQFVLDAGGLVTAGMNTEVRIYTARRSQNTINATINGTTFTPGAFGVDTTTEQWKVYYPGGTYGGDTFNLYYKEPQATPTPPPIPIPTPVPTPSGLPVAEQRLFFAQVATNFVELPYILPVLNLANWYHLRVCDRFHCDPTFSPYGSFIFEDNVYWIGTGF